MQFGHDCPLTELGGRPGDTKKHFMLLRGEKYKELIEYSNTCFSSQQDLFLQTQMFKNGNGLLER